MTTIMMVAQLLIIFFPIFLLPTTHLYHPPHQKKNEHCTRCRSPLQSSAAPLCLQHSIHDCNETWISVLGSCCDLSRPPSHAQPCHDSVQSGEHLPHFNSIPLQPFQIQLNQLKNHLFISMQQRPTQKWQMKTAATALVTNICPHNMNQIASEEEIPNVQSNMHCCWGRRSHHM